MEMKTKRLALRPLVTSDLHTTHNYANDWESTKYMLFQHKETLEETRQFLAEAEAEWKKASPAFYEFAVTLDGKHIGAVSVYLDEEHGQTGELGWILDREHWGKGYALEAVQALMKFALKGLNLKKFVAHCDCRNTASERLMKKLGLQKEGEGVRRYPDERGSSGEYAYSLEVK